MNKENKSNDIENKTSFKNFVIYQDFSNAKIPFSNNKNNNYNQDTTNKISDTFSENNNKIRIEIEKNSKNEFSFFQQNKKKIILLFLFSIILTILISKLNKKKDSFKQKENSPINPIQKNKEHIQSEFALKFEPKKLKHILIEQNYTEKIVTNGNESSMKVQRKTNYEMFIISAENSTEENKNFFDKKFIVAIIINNQCISTNNEKCVPTKITKENINVSLKQIDEIDFKNYPIPLCLFNITDNDVITSLKCPEKLQTSIIQNMILDLYFFRPPAIKRPDKIRGNITIKKWRENDKFFIHELNGGICDVSDSFDSFCTTEMNSTLDLNGILLNYFEIATTNITFDDDNSFYKIKNTTLIDVSKDFENVDENSYEIVLNKIISKLNLKFKEEFSNEQFKILYKLSKNMTENERRNLNEKEKFSAEEELVNVKHFGGVKTMIKLKNEIKLNLESMKAMSNLIIDETEKEISNLKEFSNVGEVLNSLIILSKSGNEMLLELYKKINECFENFPLFINDNITNLFNIIVFNDLSEIFSFSVENVNFPVSILNESFILNENLEKNYNENENEMKKNIENLNLNIKNFFEKENFLVENIFKKIEKLNEILLSSKSKISEISTYFSNYSSFSFVDVIRNSENVLMNFKNEKKIIFDKIKNIFFLFENGIKNSIEKEEKIIENLLLKIENKNVLINATQEQNENFKLNLQNVKKNINEIIKKNKEKIENEINLNFDFNEKNYFEIIENSIKNANKFDNNEFYDKNYCETMKNFKENFTKIFVFMNKIKKEEFLLNENLNDFFNENFNDFQNEIENLIKNENENFLNDFNKIKNDFIKENNLNEIFLNLTIFFSEETLENLLKIFNENFEFSLEKIQIEIEKNKNLSFEYFEAIKNLSKENSYILKLLKKYKNDKTNIKNRIKQDDLYLYFQNFVDTINSKSITEGYLTKYFNYKNNFQESKNFLSNDFLNSIKNEYYKINKIKDSLNKIKNDDFFFDFPDLNFIDKNIKKINDFKEKLNKFFSEEKFNDFILPKINEFKINKLNEIENINLNIENYHNEIKNKTQKIQNDFQNDFCVDFLRKKTYTCTNGVLYYYKSSDNYCFYLNESNNDNNLIKISSNSINFYDFLGKFNKFYFDLNFFVDDFYSKIENFKKKIFEFKNEFLNNNNKINEKMKNFKNKIENILNDFYEKKLIVENYVYFKNKTNEKMNFFYENFEKNSFDLFSNFKTEILNNFENYKNSIDEFETESKIIKNILIENVTKNFYDSIILHQKNEFNFSINFHYDFLLKKINSTFQTISNKIPQNKNNLNEILKNRENLINSFYIEIVQMIFNSKKLSLNLNFQLNSIENQENNFLKTNEKFYDFKSNLNSNLTKISNEISEIKNDKINDEFSLTLKFYLENSENGKQINNFYNEINNNFINLNLENFKEKFFKNFVFSEENFIKKLNSNFLNSNFEISKEFQSKIKEFSFSLENLIKKYFTKEEIILKINEFYNNSFNNKNVLNQSEINENIENILQKINEILINEEKKIIFNIYNKNLSKINKTFDEIKNKFFSNLNNTIFNVLNEVYNKINKNVYSNYVEYYLNLLYENVNFIISDFEQSKLLNSTFDFKEIINEILIDLINDYKNVIKSQIFFKYNQNYKKIFDEIDLNSIKNIIHKKFNFQFEKFYKILENYSKEENFIFYDLNDEIKNEINEIIEINMNKFNEIVKKTKNVNFEINIKNWKIPDFSRLNLNINEIKISFDKFILNQKINEKNDFNEFVKKLIKLNFNDFLNINFFENYFNRIIFYNENFNINNLFNNLKLSLFQTFSFYSNLFKNSIKTLTKDLKNKLFNLNDLDKIIIKKNNQILEFLNEKIEIFIENFQIETKEKFLFLIKNCSLINESFNEEINEIINENLNFVIFEIENDFNVFLQDFFKKKLIESFSKILNEKSNEMFIIIKNQKNLIKEKFDDLFCLDTDEVLNEINNEINNTQIAINNYYDNLNSFEISEKLLFYFENFGHEKIKPIFKNFSNLLNFISKNEILDKIENNSILYEKNYNKEKILFFLNESFNEIKNFIDIMNNSIYFYGIDEYENNLNKKIHQKNRILNKENLYEKKIADKSIDETFHKLLNNSKNLKNFIKKFEKFDEFEKIIQKNINNLFSSYKNSKNIIKNNNYDEENFLKISNKLEKLKNSTFNYYIQINESFYKNKIYFTSSIEKIDHLLNLCANKTFSTFAKKYYEISNITQSKNNDQEEFEEEISINEHESLSQNMQYYSNIILKNIKKKANFNFVFNFDEINNLKMPKIHAHVINLSKPKNMILEIFNNIGTCGKNVEKYEFDFNNVNLSMILDFNTDSNDIFYTVVTDFDSFNYTLERYLIENLPKNICLNDEYENNNFIINICFDDIECLDSTKKIVLPKSIKNVDKKYYKNVVRILN